MKLGLTKKDGKFLSATLALCGTLMIVSGFSIGQNTKKPIIKKDYSFNITEEKVASAITNEIKLKNIELEINTPMSLNVKDYIENPDNIENSVIKALKLDTSMVNINQAGAYTYTIGFKKKKYNGTITVKEKEIPKVEITLKNISLEKGSALSTNASTYIVEELSDEIKNTLVINLKDVNTTQTGEYQYTITYDNRLYTGKIWIYEKQTTTITPNDPEITPSPSSTEEQVNTN